MEGTVEQGKALGDDDVDGVLLLAGLVQPAGYRGGIFEGRKGPIAVARVSVKGRGSVPGSTSRERRRRRAVP